MAAPSQHSSPVGPDTLITVKVVLDGQNRRFKLALRDLGAPVLPQKLRVLLAIPPDAEVKFDRFSDSAGAYVTLDSSQPAIYKQLYRAAKAKLKLRLRATVIKPNKSTINIMDEQPTQAESSNVMPAAPAAEPRSTYLETVLQPLPSNTAAPSFKVFTESNRPPQPTCTIPGAFYAGDSYMDPPPRPAPRSAQLSQPTLPSFHDFSAGTFSIDCNHCGKSIPNEHFHCSICEKGDFDLCRSCLDSGVTCDGDNHWLIKRHIRNGTVIASVTDTCQPRKGQKSEPVETPVSPSHEEGERTCNCCINQLSATAFVTCKNCPDFDLCFACFQHGEHGHHPAHVFEPVDNREVMVSNKIKTLCKAGRNMIHQATCDGCNKQITGARHKCLSCPDWDFCSECSKTASATHPGHRFAALYDLLGYVSSRKEHHRGIYCDGALCTAQRSKSYIRGDRYKCAVCHDTDFCANCEAHPNNPHNKTHPLIKIRVPIRQVSIHTISENDDGQVVDQLGDRPLAKHASTETIRTTSTNAATQVQTVAEYKPADDNTSVSTTTLVRDTEKAASTDLQAWYESDSTPDGSDFGPNRFVAQSWTLRNPGPEAWPAGCAVYYIGGDDMRNLDARRPSSVSTMTVANRSNILDNEIESGKTAVFTVLLRSPAREGRAISYWRLKTPDGTPFGHKLWVDINVKAMPVELPIRTAVVPSPPAPAVEDVPEVGKSDKTEESSQMIFPKLEKESPVSSIHNVAETPAATVEPTTKTEEQDLLDEVESLELEDESEDEAFLTDEEYDILDASDEDFLEAQEAASKK